MVAIVGEILFRSVDVSIKGKTAPDYRRGPAGAGTGVIDRAVTLLLFIFIPALRSHLLVHFM